MFSHLRLLSLLILLLAVGCTAAPQDAPLARTPNAERGAPKPKPQPAPVKFLYFTNDWPQPAHTAAELQAMGYAGVVFSSAYSFGVQNRPVSLAELKAEAATIRARYGAMEVWWSFSAVKQANPGAGTPIRTFCHPKDKATLSWMLGNYASVGQAAREAGFAGVAIDAESMNPGALIYPDEPGTKDLGKAVATAYRQNNASLKLAMYGPMGGTPPGFKKVWHGFCEQAGDAYVFTENTYSASIMSPKDVQKALDQARDLTGARYPCAGWWASTNAPDVAGWWSRAVPQLREAAKAPYIFVYREGKMSADQQAALGRTVRAIKGE